MNVYEYAGFRYEMRSDSGGTVMVVPAPGQHPSAGRDKHLRAALRLYMAETTPFDRLDAVTQSRLVEDMRDRGEGRPPHYSTTEHEAREALRAMSATELRCWLRDDTPIGMLPNGTLNVVDQ